MRPELKKQIDFLIICLLLSGCMFFSDMPPSSLGIAKDIDIQNQPDYWCPEIVFEKNTAKFFKLESCKYLSGITIKLRFIKGEYPAKLIFTYLDNKGKILGTLDTNDKKFIFSPKVLKAGQFGIFTLHSGNKKPATIQIEAAW